jgi:hypothetical protein
MPHKTEGPEETAMIRIIWAEIRPVARIGDHAYQALTHGTVPNIEPLSKTYGCYLTSTR